MRKLRQISKYNDLAIYNIEVSRGLIHIYEYRIKMEKLQKEYNKQLREDTLYEEREEN